MVLPSLITSKEIFENDQLIADYGTKFTLEHGIDDISTKTLDNLPVLDESYYSYYSYDDESIIKVENGTASKYCDNFKKSK